jgi:hypothetical protein
MWTVRLGLARTWVVPTGKAIPRGGDKSPASFRLYKTKIDSMIL